MQKQIHMAWTSLTVDRSWVLPPLVATDSKIWNLPNYGYDGGSKQWLTLPALAV